jgi:hypothetical protein
MAQPTWITPAGSLGVIPEDVFYQQELFASVPAYPVPALCTATTAGTNLITCDSTADAVPGRVVRFTGTNFGGLEENITYFVLSVISSTQFTVTTNPDSQTPVTLTTATGTMTGNFFQRVYYRLQAGTVPSGIQISTFGIVTGVPQAVARVQGVPTPVNRDVTDKFTIRAFTYLPGTTVIDSIADRTFSLTVTGNDVPTWITPAGNIGTYYDGDQVELQLQYTDEDPDESIIVRLVSGQLPLGLRLSETGRIFGYIKPAPDEDKPVGYDLTPIATVPYDFISAAISKNYQFTLEVTDGKASSLRTFTIFVYNRADLTADDTYITADGTFVTADQTPERAPFLVNADPSNIGTYRGNNYFAYRFIGEDYDTSDLEYVISVNEGFGLPPGIELDPYSGWYYGFIPDVGVTENTYSFFIQVRARSLVCTATTASTNVITCDTATRADFYVGAAVEFEGETFGGIANGTTYYVQAIVSDTEFTVSTTIGGPAFALTTASGRMLAVPEDIPSSQLYPFTITITGGPDSEVIWITDPDLGVIENGATSLLRIEAVNRGGVPLLYQLVSGDFNQLPQGLRLLSSGDIAGRVTFNTFSIDLGTTTFDLSQSTVTGLSPTTFDSVFRFTAQAYAEDPQQPLFKLSAVKIINRGSGYISAPSIVFDAPVGATAVRATATTFVSEGQVISVVVTNSGADYTGVPGFTITGVGTGLSIELVMQQTGIRRIINSDRTFQVRVARVYNKPYQNLYIVAMPPQQDRALLQELLTDQEIFVPEFIFRPDDANFGLSQRITYEHAVGLDPDTIETYIQSLNLNHYWKNLVLGSIETAQAVTDDGTVIYEVVYSRIIDDLVNNQGESVSKIVTLPYTITDPADGSTQINSVYPNSLVNMRDQVIDVVGQISNKLPLWMTSKQSNGRVLGFTPAWVICYTNPGRSAQIAYYIDRYFGQRLNLIDFKVDRYVLDRELSRNWDTETQNWTPDPNLTTFDRINTSGYTDLGQVQACTELAYADVNNRPLSYINSLGGLDGATWIVADGQTPPVGTRVVIRDGSRIVFVKQENFSDYLFLDNAFSNNVTTFDDGGFDPLFIDNGSGGRAPATNELNTSIGSLDFGTVIPGGTTAICSSTDASTDSILCTSTLGLGVGDKIWFTGSVFGGIAAVTGGGLTQLYYCQAVVSITATSSLAATDRITVSSVSNLSLNDEIWFPGTTFGGIRNILPNGLPKPYYVAAIVTGTNEIEISETPGGSTIPLDTATGSMTINLNRFKVTKTPGSAQPEPLSTATGVMTANFNNDRMAIYTISILPGEIIQLTLEQQTITNDFVTSVQGAKYAAGTLLYRPAEVTVPLTRINWQPLISAITVLSDETIFDENSLQFIEPVDIYDPTDSFDKYLIFPKDNILV